MLLFGVTSVVAQIFLDYKRYVSVLKWLTLCLFAYVAALAFANVSWGEALAGMLVPRIELERGLLHHHRRDLRHHDLALSVLLAGLAGSRRPARRRDKQPLIDKHYGARQEFQRIRADTIVGMAFSNLIALSIIITAAATLHAAGKTDIQTSAQAAEALRPIAGAFAEVIFALGIVGTGLLAIPVLAGSTAYAVGEGRRWPVVSRASRRKPSRSTGAGAVGRHRHRAQLHPDQSDLGAVLERGHQRRARGAGDGAPDVHGAAQGRHGPLRDRRPAVLARVAVDRSDDAQRRGDGNGFFAGK